MKEIIKMAWKNGKNGKNGKIAKIEQNGGKKVFFFGRNSSGQRLLYTITPQLCV